MHAHKDLVEIKDGTLFVYNNGLFELTNLTHGDGWVPNDVYFCDPLHPVLYNLACVLLAIRKTDDKIADESLLTALEYWI